MENKIEISIIITCYNYGIYLEECLNSIRIEKNIEIILIDDGSNDEFTIKYLDKLTNSKKNLNIIRTENNGTCVARNIGVKNSSGKYIVMLDADDCLCDNFIKSAKKVLDGDSNIGIVKGNVVTLKSGVKKRENYKEFNLKEFLIGNTLPVSCMFRKQDYLLVGGYNEMMSSGLEDFEFWMSILELKREVKIIDVDMIVFRKHNNGRNLSFDNEKRRELWKNILRKHIELYVDNPEILYKVVLDINPDKKKELKKSKKNQNRILIITCLLVVVSYYLGSIKL
ncbi:MAG: glycosyltransferase family A protein [Cetobacterium sp.]